MLGLIPCTQQHLRLWMHRQAVDVALAADERGDHFAHLDVPHFDRLIVGGGGYIAFVQPAAVVETEAVLAVQYLLGGKEEGVRRETGEITYRHTDIQAHMHTYTLLEIDTDTHLYTLSRPTVEYMRFLVGGGGG